jgi:serine/threonine protein kinase
LDDSLNNLKIADFGLSEFYRPGGTLSSAIGTLSFQAPEMFSNANYAGKRKR